MCFARRLAQANHERAKRLRSGWLEPKQPVGQAFTQRIECPERDRIWYCNGECVCTRTSPLPSGIVGAAALPVPPSMMGQFKAEISTSTQKKHSCKVCDKRFTHLCLMQTHMYSHTDEKPFACEHDRCRRAFSVISNLQHHGKVHKGEGASANKSSEHSQFSVCTKQKDIVSYC